MIKYLALSYGLYNIEVKEVTKESAASVWVKFPHGDLHRKKWSEYQSYHNTWTEAKEALLINAEKKMHAAQSAFEDSMRELEAVRAMRNPDEVKP